RSPLSVLKSRYQPRFPVISLALMAEIARAGKPLTSPSASIVLSTRSVREPISEPVSVRPYQLGTALLAVSSAFRYCPVPKNTQRSLVLRLMPTIGAAVIGWAAPPELRASNSLLTEGVSPSSLKRQRLPRRSPA